MNKPKRCAKCAHMLCTNCVCEEIVSAEPCTDTYKEQCASCGRELTIHVGRRPKLGMCDACLDARVKAKKAECMRANGLTEEQVIALLPSRFAPAKPPVCDQIISLRLTPAMRSELEELCGIYGKSGKGAFAGQIRHALWVAVQMARVQLAEDDEKDKNS